jgi:hypothetical protein
VQLVTLVNCNIFMHYIQNNSSFKLFKHEAMLIRSVSLLGFSVKLILKGLKMSGVSVSIIYIYIYIYIYISL